MNQVVILVVIFIVKLVANCGALLNMYFFRMHRMSRQNSLTIKRAMNDGIFCCENKSSANEIFKLDVLGDVVLKYPEEMLRPKLERGYETNKLFYCIMKKPICFISLKIESKLAF